MNIISLNYPLICIIIGAFFIGHGFGKYGVSDWGDLIIGALMVGLWIGDYWKTPPKKIKK